MTDAEKGERLAKRLARMGVTSRRQAELLITDGRVKVDGKTVRNVATNVGSNAVLHVDNKPIIQDNPVRLWLYHKARGVMTTHKDPEGRPTVFERLPKDLPRVISIGRLDFNTEGLLLLTTHGGLARHLELPSTGWKRKYRVRVHGKVDPDRLAQLAEGISIDGVQYRPAEATLDSQNGSNAWITITLQEGKNREVRHLMAHLDYTVTRLIRVSYGIFTLGDLATGSLQEVPRRVLKSQLPPAIWKDVS